MAARTLIAMVASPDAVPDRQDVLGVVKTMSEPVQDRAVAALVGLLSHGDPDIVPDVVACLPEAGPRRGPPCRPSKPCWTIPNPACSQAPAWPS